MPACLYFDICGNFANPGATLCTECSPLAQATQSSPVLSNYLEQVRRLVPVGSALSVIAEEDDEDDDDDEGLPSAMDTAPAWAPFLDAMAGLCWLGDTKAICCAVAVVVEKKQPKLLITANLLKGALTSLQKNTCTIERLPFSKEKKVKPYFDACVAIANDKMIGNATLDKKLAQLLRGGLSDCRSLTFASDPSGYTHAEMRILDELFLGKVSNPGDTVYIGISASCCDNCYKAILAFNAAASAFEFGYQIKVFGAHGVKYSTAQWPLPLFLHPRGHKSALQGNFATKAREVFWAQFEGGENAFNIRADSEQDETQHARPSWSFGSGTFTKN